MLARTLAALATLAGAGLAATALAAHQRGLILAGILASILARVATIATRHGHFIYSYLRFFLRKVRSEV